MSQIQMVHSFGDVPWLFRIQRAGLPFAYSAKSAVTRADIAAKHERGGTIGPTLENVRTTRFLANCVQVETLDQLQYLVLVSRIAQTDAQPFGLGLTDLLIVADYSEFAGQLFTSGGILQYKLFSSECRRDCSGISCKSRQSCNPVKHSLPKERP